MSITRFLIIAILYFSVGISILYTGLNRTPFRETSNRLPAPAHQEQQCAPAAEPGGGHGFTHVK